MRSLLSAAFIAASLLSTEAFVPEKVDFNDFVSQSSTAQEVIRRGLVDTGIISVKNIPNFKELREDILVAASECALHTKSTSDISLRTVLNDETSRYTLAMETIGGETKGFEGADMSFAGCKKFVQLEGEFRELVSKTVSAFVKNVDTILENGNGRKLMFDEEKNGHFTTLEELLDEGLQLEHFHTYEKFPSSFHNSKHYTIEPHLDQGLFIALTPGLTFSNKDRYDHGFFIELPSGEIVKPDFGEHNAEIVFALGDGFDQWINPKTDLAFRPVPHAVMMPKNGEEMTLRSWYGRMILPKPSTYLEPQGKTFGQLRSEMMKSNGRDLVATSTCSNEMTLSGRELQACSSNQIRCWAQCMTVSPACDAGEEAHCMIESGDSFAECDPEAHTNGNCNPVCIDSNFTAVDIGNDFCNGIAVSMYMTGFQSTGISSRECVAFLFEDFLLDSPGKFVLAMIVSMFIGILTEFIVYMRRLVAQKMTDGRSKTCSRLCLYFLQVMFGYIAMLIAMTYSTLLFLSIIVGLTIGHRCFNFDVTPTEFSDPCCAQPDAAPVDEKDV